MVFSFCIFFWLTAALALERDICDSAQGNVSNHCIETEDDAASFLQKSTVASRGNKEVDDTSSSAHESKTHALVLKGSKRVEKVDCLRETKPFQMLKENWGFSLRHLDIRTGRYTTRQDFRFDDEETIPGGYADLNACGINPVDDIIYCVIRAEGYSWAMRVDVKGNIEYVARLPTLIWSSAAFSKRGEFFVSTHSALFICVKGLADRPGYQDREDPDLYDARKMEPTKPKGWLYAADIVVVNKKFPGHTSDEFVLAVYGAKWQLGEWDFERGRWIESWVTWVKPARWDNVFGAGWVFRNEVFFSVNRGAGVYHVPLGDVDLDAMRSPETRTNITLELVGLSEQTTFNDGFNCINQGNPWANLPPPKPGYVLITVTTTTTTTTTTTSAWTPYVYPANALGPVMKPFGQENTAKQLQGHAARTQDVLVDAMENAQVAELKRTIYRSLTRLRSAQVKEYDTIARNEVQAVDQYNDLHHYRLEHPLRHLHTRAEKEVWADKYTSWQPEDNKQVLPASAQQEEKPA